MDIHQLRSWIFELYEPLENERQYIVFDNARGNLLIDVPQFSPRAERLIAGTGRAGLLVVTNRRRAELAQRYRETLGVRIAAHADDASAIGAEPDLILSDDQAVRPDVRAIRVRSGKEGATVLLIRKAGGVLVCGDLDLASSAARSLEPLEFSAVLSSGRAPMWNAGKDTLLLLQQQLPKARKQFSILLPPPWDRAYLGRLEDKMAHNEKIVPREETSSREAAMGQTTLVVSQQARDLIGRAKAPLPASAAGGGNGAGAAGATAARSATAAGGAPPAEKRRPKPFAEDWDAVGTERPATTIANAATDIVPVVGQFTPQPIGARFKRHALEDIAGAPYVDWSFGAIDLSPQGDEVAFSWNKTGNFEIYSAPIDRDKLFQLTEGSERSVSPRWSPDGRSIAFLRDRGGDERWDIWIVDREGERERNLTEEPKVTHRDIAWSPDGTHIAFVSNVGGKGFGISVVDVKTGVRRQLTDGSHEDMQPKWSPDGKRIIFASRREKVRTNVGTYLISVNGVGAPTLLDTRQGKDGESMAASFAPDGERIAFATNVRGRYEPAIARLAGDKVSEVEYLTQNIHDETEPVWRQDGRGLLFLHSEESEIGVRRVFAVSHATHAVADRPGVHASAHVGPDSDLVAFVWTGAREPWDVYVTRERSVAPKRLTRSLPSTVDPASLVEPIHVRYPGADGREIPALLYVPHAEAVRGDGPPPAIVHVHGGPTGQHLRWWDRASQWFANNGYVVLAPNIRGSTGYGREFQEANRGDWGGKDLVDVTKGAEWLAKQKIADAKRIGVYGGSYGGFMTHMVLTQAPDLWAAGVSIVGVVSWKTLYDTTRGDLKDYLERELGDPAKVPDLYRDRSPLTHVSKIKAPLLILQGANDPRVPQSEAKLMTDALKSAGKTFDQHVYEGEGHGFRTKANMIDALRRATEWFDKYLQSRA